MGIRKVTPKKKAAKKKAAKKKTKRTNVPGSTQPPLDPDWETQVPAKVVDKVDEYLKALKAKSKADKKAAVAKSDAYTAMEEYGLRKIRIDDGKRWLIREDKPGLKTERVNLEKDDTRQSVSP